MVLPSLYCICGIGATGSDVMELIHNIIASRISALGIITTHHQMCSFWPCIEKRMEAGRIGPVYMSVCRYMESRGYTALVEHEQCVLMRDYRKVKSSCSVRVNRVTGVLGFYQETTSYGTYVCDYSLEYSILV